MIDSSKIAVVILAAGESKRLGQPKQLLLYKKPFLLDYIIDECLKFNTENLYVVLGANEKIIQDKLSNLESTTILYHTNWKDGLSSSIAFATAQLAPKYNSIIFVLSDQIFFDTELLYKLTKAKKETNTNIVYSQYQIGQGPPILFDNVVFEDLKKLKGDAGAKEILLSNKYSSSSIPFEKGYVDIDTSEDLHYLD